MATRDVRFFEQGAPRLADGLPRHGMSVVAALSTWLRHTNHRGEGSWTQEYRHGVPAQELREAEPTGGTGTTVHFLPVPELGRAGELDTTLLTDLWLDVRLRREG
jgi:DNA gyrase subunit B